jgi:hypothetical protein
VLTKQDLIKIKVKALRRGVWFKTLSKVERGIIDLTIRCVEKIKSCTLMKTVLAIFSKLLNTLEKDFIKRIESIGRVVAKKVCRIATQWGHYCAWLWEYDINFVKFLGVIFC